MIGLALTVDAIQQKQETGVAPNGNSTTFDRGAQQSNRYLHYYSTMPDDRDVGHHQQ